ncbi:YibE/F family protein [Allorhizocola rhizosphaerae]|uniref:YibE/F family protein n=1 Tax=Allorhizocola rhizosphaerae TaxID=1872709 RepID=UPI000E3BFCAF|nr:YibE/F family protein [Allorhizocola rhizosphaerae]
MTGHAHEYDKKATRLTLAVLIPAAALTLIGLLLLWPGKIAAEPWTGPPHHTGDVVTVHQRACTPDEAAPDVAAQVCGEVTVRLNDGPDAGRIVSTRLPSGPGAPVVKPGDRVILVYGDSFDDPTGTRYEIIDHERGTQIWLLVLIFALTIVAFGRWRGVTALAGLGVTFMVLLAFIVPAILQGEPPLLVAIVGSAAIMLVVLYLTHGFSTQTSMAVLGTLASLALTGALAAFTTAALHLTGVADEQASFLTIQYGDVNMLGLLLAGIIIGALGVLDDVTVTQSYTVAELARANPAMGFAELYRAASRVGRAHITSVINTIVLAYAGASLPLLLLLSAGPGQSNGGWLQMLKSEQLAQEIVRSAVGTIGLIAAVPITTALAALAVRGRPIGLRFRPPRPRRRRPDPLESAWGLEPEAVPQGDDPR